MSNQTTDNDDSGLSTSIAKMKLETKNQKEMINTESSKNQTKKWRKDNICPKDGQKDSSCEKYQINQVEQITNKDCNKTNGIRINHRTLELRKIAKPMTQDGENVPDGFDWSEDVDALQKVNDKTLYYNFKFVCEGGGAQTRTLRNETYCFIETQLKYIKNNSTKKIIFINILDGYESYFRMSSFNYLLNLPEYKEHNSKCFVGDMKQFQEWFSEFNK